MISKFIGDVFNQARLPDSSKTPNARHHPPPSHFANDENQRVGGRVHAVVRRGDIGKRTWISPTRDGGRRHFINQHLAVINRDRIRPFEQTIRAAVDDQLIVADQDIGVTAWRETVGLFAWTSHLLRRSDTRAVTIGDSHGMTADCRLDTSEQ
jgi:hypothetical protein